VLFGDFEVVNGDWAYSDYTAGFLYEAVSKLIVYFDLLLLVEEVVLVL
jgi:hypothetical protein